jgi:hypothetical protein
MKVNEKRKLFGVTMTKRAWNNVLVYVILIIMFVFWYVAPPLKETNEAVPESTEQIGLIPDNGSLSAIEMPDLTLQLANSEWHCVNDCRLTSQQISGVVNNWLSIKMTPIDVKVTDKITDVLLSFNDGNTARVELYASPYLILRLPNQQQNFRIENLHVSQLLGR